MVLVESQVSVPLLAPFDPSGGGGSEMFCLLGGPAVGRHALQDAKVGYGKAST